MDVVGSEIGQKMRSAIKAKLTELGCYVDDELPDYVMVMVANKRTRTQMEDDLLLFLGDNTESFVNWLHQVLKKLQEVTVTAPLKQIEHEKSSERSKSKERKSKAKKLKEKSKKGDGSKKAKKKDKLKEKLHRKKEEKRVHKSKKKSKHHELIRPNVPPLLMNIEKESEPSITDVFAGQILKNHGIVIDTPKEDPKTVDKKPILPETKRPILPIIDPATISSQPESSQSSIETTQANSQELLNRVSDPLLTAPREEQIDEINKIEARIQGLKQKLEEQLDESMSDDEDFLNIRTEAEELMNDFAEDVFQEITQTAPAATPPLHVPKSPVNTTPTIPKAVEIPKETPKDIMETLPQIELNLPKRPIRERLGVREEPKKVSENKEKSSQSKRADSPKTTDKRNDSPERFTPEREPEFRPQSKSVKSRLGDLPEQRKGSISEESDISESNSKRITSKVSIESRATRSTCASVVRVRPRPRVAAPASSLLLRAVADAHKSLLSIPPKMDTEPQKVKRALVLPMRRCVDAQKIVIQVPARDGPPDTDTDGHTDKTNKTTTDDSDKDKKYSFTSFPITKKINNTEYTPRRSEGRNATRRDDSLIIETINIHNTTVDKEKDTQFIVTMDGYHPNAFLAKKLMTEGLLDDEDLNLEKCKEKSETTEETNKDDRVRDIEPEKSKEIETDKIDNVQNKRLSNTSEESITQVIIKQEKQEEQVPDERNISESSTENQKEESPTTRKRRASPIVFDVDNKVKVRERERTESLSSDNHVTITTTTNSHKYDSVPPLTIGQTDRPLVACRAFPLCRYGSACAFTHPRCKFAAACTRRGCVYSHPQTRPAAPLLASHVVPAANYKTISSSALPAMCKYYPNCVNPACHFYHPKPCRYGKHCLNKLECNFYHSDTPSNKWRYPV